MQWRRLLDALGTSLRNSDQGGIGKDFAASWKNDSRYASHRECRRVGAEKTEIATERYRFCAIVDTSTTIDWQNHIGNVFCSARHVDKQRSPRGSVEFFEPSVCRIKSDRARAGVDDTGSVVQSCLGSEQVADRRKEARIVLSYLRITKICYCH